MTKLIKENSEIDDFVFTFPHIKLYNILSNRMYMPTFVPCYWFDVCSDSYAEEDLSSIEKNMPDLIVWCDVGESAWKIHETLFRNGNRSSQRDIQDWFESVKETKYTKIGGVYNISVYKLNNSKPINYTYFASREDIQSEEYEILYNDDNISIFRNILKNNGVWNKILFGILTIASIFAFFSHEYWKKYLIIISFLACILKVTPFYFALYMIPLYLWTYFNTEKSTKNYMYFYSMAIIVLSVLFTYSKDWKWIANIPVALSFGVLIIAITEVFFLLITRNYDTKEYK